jgi:signal transduction histidine kinase
MTDQLGFAIAYGVIVAAPMMVGAIARRVQGNAHFARLLFATGALFAVTALSLSHDATLYSIGRVAVWLVEPAVVLLILTFPSGRFTGTWERRLAIALFAVVAALYLPTALVVDHYPEPTPWSDCGTDCPDNAFAVLPGASGFVDDAVRPLREVLVVLLLVGVTVALVRRRRRSPPLLRRALTPVVLIGLFQVVTFAAYQWGRRNGTVSPELDALGWVFLLSLPAVATSFAAGLLNRRLHLASALEHLASRLLAAGGPIDLRGRLADSLEDPSVRVAFRVEDEPVLWVDEAGLPTDPPYAPPGRTAVEVDIDGGYVAVVDHDEVLAPDPALIDAVAAYGFVIVENRRLIAQLRTSLLKVSELESAHESAAAVERRRIERDLHDGAQQRLLALRINLELVSERLGPDAPAQAAEIHELADQVERTIHAVRTLAHGTPALLVEAGLGGALQVAAAESSLPTTVRTDGIGRYDAAVETAIYFSCVEALQNAVKHAHGATHVAIQLDAAEDLRFEVRDDGPGFTIERPEGDGAGLRNIRDRLTAVGGRLELDARPGHGVRVVGTVPLP